MVVVGERKGVHVVPPDPAGSNLSAMHTHKRKYTYRDGIFRNCVWIYLVHAPVDDVKWGSLMERQHRISVPVVNVPFLFL